MKKLAIWPIMTVFCFALPHIASSDATLDDQQAPLKSLIICLDEASDGQTIFLKRGWFVHVNLMSTPSTGYEWFLEDLNEDIVDFYCKTSVAIPPVMPGSPSESKWFFEAMEGGFTRMVLKYYRSWEGPESAASTLTVLLVVF